MRPFGPTATDVGAIGQGTWLMERDTDASMAALRRGMDLGMTHIDTAEMYGSGRVEEIVGKGIAGRREEVFLASKVMPSNASTRGAIKACEQSLRRLATDRLDLYLLHWPSRHPFEETLAAFNRLRNDGKIGLFGVSNFDAEKLKAAIKTAGAGQIACNQVLYYLDERAIEHDIIGVCQSNDIALVGYSPFGQGDFRDDHPVLQMIAKARNASPRQVALRFLLREQGTFTIPKSSSVAHVEENAAASDLALTDEDLIRIDQAFPLGPRPRRLPTL